MGGTSRLLDPQPYYSFLNNNPKKQRSQSSCDIGFPCRPRPLYAVFPTLSTTSFTHPTVFPSTTLPQRSSFFPTIPSTGSRRHRRRRRPAVTWARRPSARYKTQPGGRRFLTPSVRRSLCLSCQCNVVCPLQSHKRRDL